MTDLLKTPDETDCSLKNMLLKALPLSDTVIEECGPLRHNQEVAKFTVTFRFPFSYAAPVFSAISETEPSETTEAVKEAINNMRYFGSDPGHFL